MKIPFQRVAELSTDKRNELESRLLQKLSAAQNKGKVAAAKGPRKAAVSTSQESLWFLDQLNPNSPLYNIAQAFRLSGPLDAGALQKSFDTVLQRHEILRASFSAVDGKPVQTIRPSGTFVLEQVDLQQEGQPQAEAERRLNAEARKPFNLQSDLLIRGTLLRVSATEHFLLIVVHHIVADFSSLVVFYRELGDYYNGYLTGKEAALPELEMQFPEWAACEKERLQGDSWNQKLAYWKKKLSGELPSLNLPTDHSRPAQQSFKGAKHDLKLSAELLNQLKELSRREGTTVYLTLLAAFAVLLKRYSGQNELIIGSPIDQRNTSAAEKLVGYFINTVPLRTTFPSDCSFRDALREIRTVALEAFVHQEMPFEKMVEGLQLTRAQDHNPVFQVVFQYLPKLPMLQFQTLNAVPVSLHTGTAKFDLTFTLAEANDGITGEIEYNVDLFEAATIERMSGHYETLLQSVIKAPVTRISTLAFLTKAEERQILGQWNETGTKYPRHACVHELFQDQVDRSPEAVALKFAGQTMTYRALNARANQLANRLQQLGVGQETLVGVALERSFEVVVTLLAVLKAGGAYVPLDPSYPRERLDYILKDTGVSVLVTTTPFQELGAGVPNTLLLDAEGETLAKQEQTNLISNTAPNSLAYVMYTSGSTGKPKGVLIPHRGITRLVKETNYARFSTSDVFLQFAPISFDASTFEIWGALLNGAKLVIYPPEMLSLANLGDFLLSEEITTLWLTAGLFHQMVDENVEKLRGLKQLLAGGDVLAVPQVLKALRELPNCQLINGYGPTENTTFTCCYTVPRDWSGAALPIGKPISNTKVYILDDALQPVPVAVSGELYIGGDGLAREYLHAPELTAQKLPRNPFGNTAEDRLYKTGDLVRWQSDGTIEFLGRLDNQVKVRGFRVELGEIETVLSQHAAVQESAVLARQTPVGKELVAYVVSKDKSPIDAGTLRSFLQQKLPPYMVPAHFVSLERFPLTANGKIDRQKLPAPEGRVPDATLRTLPRNSAEEKLQAIWSEVLGNNAIGVEENFFELGGHSLLATQVISRAGRTFGHDLPLRLLFEHPTIATFAEAICSHRGETASDQGTIRKRARVDAVRLDQLSEAQIETMLRASQNHTP
ncbi:MAG: cyclohexanecarboxylate-CoA ligase [Verrucomicrobiales bacterium]|nr:cyclohexanecarboxylate-CoA ligase [Verrucomicrobiales bacterium]